MDTDNKVLTRAKNGVFTGTLAGFADYYNLNLSGLRFVFIVLFLCGFMGLVLYIVLRLSLPAFEERAHLLAELQAKQE
jgi:phage shock protein PspC (stress-responsive transcriptional regulator)